VANSTLPSSSDPLRHPLPSPGSCARSPSPVPSAAAEARLAGFEVVGWNGYLAPAGTPAEIVARLQRDIAVALRSPDFSDRVANQGSELVGSTSDEFAAYIASESGRWSTIVRRLGITLE